VVSVEDRYSVLKAVEVVVNGTKATVVTVGIVLVKVDVLV
jgi:hypothetical protein